MPRSPQISLAMSLSNITPIFLLLAHFENAQFVVYLQTRSIVSAQIVSLFGAVSLPWKTAACIM